MYHEGRATTVQISASILSTGLIELKNASSLVSTPVVRFPERMPWVSKANQRRWEKVGRAERGEGMNAISIQAGTASALWDTWKNIIFHRWAVREWEEGRLRWDENINEEMDRWQKRKKKSGCTWHVDCCWFIHCLTWYHFWLRCYLALHFQATEKHEFRTTAGPYATSALLHQAHVHTELEKQRHTLRETDGHSSPPWLQGSEFWARDMPASGRPVRRFDVLHLPHSATQRSSFARSVSAWVCLWSSEAKPKTLAICFMCSRMKPPTQQQQQQKQHTTGRYIHICWSDLGHYHFIVWHTICIKLQFSVLKGLAWLKTVSDVQKGIFCSH